jgi:hypothetical protein
MPASPQKWLARMAPEPIIWRENESTDDIMVISSDDEEDTDHAMRMLEPGYVSTVHDDQVQVKRKQRLLGVWFLISFSFTRTNAA